MAPVVEKHRHEDTRPHFFCHYEAALHHGKTLMVACLSCDSLSDRASSTVYLDIVQSSVVVVYYNLLRITMADQYRDTSGANLRQCSAPARLIGEPCTYTLHRSHLYTHAL